MLVRRVVTQGMTLQETQYDSHTHVTPQKLDTTLVNTALNVSTATKSILRSTPPLQNQVSMVTSDSEATLDFWYDEKYYPHERQKTHVEIHLPGAKLNMVLPLP